MTERSLYSKARHMMLYFFSSGICNLSTVQERNLGDGRLVKRAKRGNSPNTSTDGTTPSGPSVLFMASTAIDSNSHGLTFAYSSFSFLEVFRKGA